MFRLKDLNARNFNMSLADMRCFQNPKRLDSFEEWFVGVTDSSGCFMFGNPSKGDSTFSFSITQGCYNFRMLRFIQAKLGCGYIYPQNSKESRSLMFVVRDRESINSKIIPLFEKYGLRTGKEYDFQLFKKAFYAKTAMDRVPFKLALEKGIPADYVSPNKELPSISWVVGFIDAKGSFVYSAKGKSMRVVHAFDVSLKSDRHVLENLSKVLGIDTEVGYNKSKNLHVLLVRRVDEIEIICNFFKGRLVGMKTVEFRYWCNSFYNYPHDAVALTKIQNYFRLLREAYVVKSGYFCKVNFFGPLVLGHTR